MQKLLKLLNWLATRMVIVVVILTFLISGFAIWDNRQLYAEAQNVMLNFRKEDEETGKEIISFEELRALNPDIYAVLTVQGTEIDYPVVQGDTNLYYLNRNAFKESSLAGSIFLDTRNRRSMSDRYSILYGHHMDKHMMFGDLDLFKDRSFFESEPDIMLSMADGRELHYTVLAVLETMDGTRELFNIFAWEESLQGIDEYIIENALYYYRNGVETIAENPENIGIIAMITCASGGNSNRTVVLAYRDLSREEILPAINK